MRRRESSKLESTERYTRAGTGFLRIVLLFGSIAVALGLILIPRLGGPEDYQISQPLFQQPPDRVVTGSISSDTAEKASIQLPKIAIGDINQ